MDYKDFIKPGKKAVHSWRDYKYYLADYTTGRIPYEIKEEIVEIIGRPRDVDTKRFVSLDAAYLFEDEIEVKVKIKDGYFAYVKLENLEPYRTIRELGEEEIAALWKQINRGSMYVSDYNNDLGVPSRMAMDFYEGFYEMICDEYGEENAEEYDTVEGFCEYCQYAEA